MIRIATFNAENLFARYKFPKKLINSGEDISIHDIDAKFLNVEDKNLTAKVIQKINADILCLQEVENLSILDKFNRSKLEGMGYHYSLLIDSHDSRQIDVAYLSRFPFENIRTFKDVRSPNGRHYLFSRDCLTVDFKINGKDFRVYNNHFKSMGGGRRATAHIREKQSNKVIDIINKDYGETVNTANFVVVGDLNEYPADNSGIRPLLNTPFLENVLERLPKEEQWTHYYPEGDEYQQIDYIFLSKALAQKNRKGPKVERSGIARRATNYTGYRFDEVGQESPAASDHCALYMDIEL